MPIWNAYKAIAPCAPTMSELVDTLHLRGKTARTTDPIVLHVLWGNANEHLVRCRRTAGTRW